MAMLCLSISVSAYDFEVDGIRYDITSFTDLTVTASSVSENMEGSILIPSSVEFSGKTLSVTTIGDRFMESNQFITSLLISEGVREIGSYAFNNCSNLSDVSIPETVGVINNHAFAECTKIRNVTAKGAEAIGDHCFEGCTSIESVTFSILLNIPSYAFSGCYKLDVAEFPLAQTIGSFAFTGCAFSSFDVPSSVNEIKSYAFSNCVQLESFTIPNNVQIIGENLFKGCVNLNSVSIGNGIDYLPYIFDECVSLKCLRFEDSNKTLTIAYVGSRETTHEGGSGSTQNGNNYFYVNSKGMFEGKELEDVYIGRNLTTETFLYRTYYQSGAYEMDNWIYVPNPPFANSLIRKVELGFFVTDLNMRYVPSSGSWHSNILAAFQNCSQLTEIQNNSNVINIPNSTFSGCSALKAITITNTTTKIGKEVFLGCGSLESVSLGCYLKEIGAGAFTNCSKISSINLSTPIPPTYSTGFSSSEYISTNIRIPSGSLERYKSSDPWKNFWNLEESNELISLFEVDEINYLVLSGNNVQIVGEALSSQKSITITNSVIYADKEFQVVSIADNAFKNCTEIVGLEIEDGIMSIGSNAFEGCKNLNNVVLPESVNVLGVGAFKSCISLSTCSWSGSIKNLPDECFYGCASLQDVSLEGIESIGNSCFYDCDGLAKIILTPSIKSLGTDAFRACSNLKEFIIEDAYSTIDFPAGSYDGATSIQKKEINGKTIQFKIEYYNPFFSGLPIEKLYIGRNLSYSPRYTISGDGGVDYYLIKSYDAPFGNLSNLTELIVGENVSTIGSSEAFIDEVGLAVTPGSFKKCSSLKKVTVKNSTPPTGAEFSNAAYSNATLIVPDNTVSLFQVADGWKEFINILDESSAGIEPITISNIPQISIFSDGIIYEGEHDTSILICGIDGNCLYSGIVSSGQSVALSKGIYIILLDGKSIKIKI